jgi:hypothetical protein
VITEVNPLISVLSPALAKALYYAQASLSSTIHKVCITTSTTSGQNEKSHHHITITTKIPIISSVVLKHITTKMLFSE